jgi:hypothetical protein
MGKGWLEYVSENNSKNLGWGSGCLISSATPRDWVTLQASPTPWDFVTDQFDVCQLACQTRGGTTEPEPGEGSVGW